MKKIFSKLKQNRKLRTLVMSLTLALSSMSMAFAADPATGNTDLDTMLGNMTGGLDSIKVGGLYIVGAVITVAVVFLGGRWLWSLFRSWLSRAS